MDLRSFHTPLEAREHFRHLATSIADAGLVPVFGQAQRSVSEKLRMVGLSVPSTFAGWGDVEVLAQAEGEGAILLHLVSNGASHGEQSAYVADIRVVSANGSGPALEQLVREKVAKLGVHSWSEARLMERLGSSVSEWSADGPVLNNPESRQRIRDLYDDRLREALRRLLGASRGARPREAMAWLQPFADDADTRHVVFGNPAIFAQRYAVTCRFCEAPPHIAFSARDRAEALIDEVERACASCGEPGLEIAEYYRIVEDYSRALERGLWLDSLVADAVASRTDAIWLGRRIVRSDLDVIAVFAEQIFLFACRDDVLGASDVYAASRAAEHLDVDHAILVTTADPPRKVQEIVASLNSDTGGKFRVVSETGAVALRGAVQRALDDSGWKFLDRSLIDDPWRSTSLSAVKVRGSRG